MSLFRSMLLCSAMISVAGTAEASTAVLFDSLTGADTFAQAGVANSASGPLGIEFVTNSTGTVDSVSLALLGDPTNTAGSIFVSILADMGHTPNLLSTPIAFGSIPDTSLSSSLSTVVLNNSITGLTPDTAYWLMLSDSSTDLATTSAAWSATTDTLGVGVSVSYLYQGGGAAAVSDQGFTFQAKITADAGGNEGVPEPASLSVLGVGLLGLAALRRRYVR